MLIRPIIVISAVLCTAFHLAAADRPNVLLIFADDLGSIDLNCYGANDLETPHLDALAKSGVKFNQFYASAPVCSPSRAALLTGRYPQRAGVPGNVSSKAGNVGMPASQITIAEELKQNGYATAHIGKWHLGYTPETMPNGQGFDYSFGHMGGCIDNYSHFFYWNGPNRHDLHRNGKEVFHDGEYFPDLMVEELNDWVDRTQDKPWFIYWAINVPHYPYQGDEKWLKHYKDVPYPRNLYNAFVSAMDERIGQVLNHLRKRGLAEDTIVIFQSDHGHSEEERAHFGGGNAGPYRGEKFSLVEGGIRVPSIISWPGSIPADQIRHQFATGSDWYPTILQLTSSQGGKHRLDGKSLHPIIWAETAPSEHKVFHWESGGGKNNRQWAVREGDWKLVVNGRNTKPDEKVFLSNLAESVSESENAADANPIIVDRLTKLHGEWKNDLGR
jgi:arylsulfatase A-like enzyme